MNLNSLSFLGIYFPLLLIAYYNPFFKNNRFRKVLLFLASLGLYAFSEPIYILLLVFVIVYNYGLVKLADKTGKNVFRVVSIILDAVILLGFKYINLFLSFLFINKELSIVFPIGLSYFTFKAISYVVDSKDTKDGDFLDVAIYISNFLTIVSGPLSTYKDELPSIQKKKETGIDSFYRGFERSIIGLGKKVIIADSLGVLVKQCFAATELSVVMAWAGAIAFTLQLFFDFSGYTDMAIGIGYIFGFDLPENFNYPYMANSISDFWKRWHMSLTKWFTKYIYIPLGGSRVKSVTRHIFNLFVVWLVTGMWHGSTLTFIVWAMIYFVLQLLEKYTKWANFLNKVHIGHIYTLLVVIIEWVIFKSSSISYALFYLGSMFHINDNLLVNQIDVTSLLRYSIPFVLGIVFSTSIGAKLKDIYSKNTVLNFIYNVCLIVLLIVCVMIMMGRGYSAPLYAGF